MHFVLAVLLLTLPALSQAQEAKYFPLWNASLIKELNLTDAQSRDIQATIREYRSRLIDLRGVLEKAEGEVADTFNEDSFDNRKATDACEKVITSRAELARVFSQMNTRLRAILTIDQWRELQKRSAAAKSSSAAQHKK